MSRFWSDIVHQLTPYVPGEQPKQENLVKLNTNENPYPPSKKVLAMLAGAANANLRLYPDPESHDLKQTLAEYFDLNTDQVFVGNGSDEVLAHIFNALLKQDLPLLFPDISYSFYPVYSQLFDIDYQTIALNTQFEIDCEQFLQANGGIIFPNPNAPTGHLLPLDVIDRLLQQNTQSVVVIDEAYIDFGGESAVHLIARYPNLLVVQTLSKSRSLAGLRVGYALGHADLIEALQRVKNSFNSYPLDRFAVAGAIAAFEDNDYFEATRQKIIDSREKLVADLIALGFQCLPSAANFIFVSHPQHDAAELAQQLRQQSIIVRYFNQPRINQHLRITIGTSDDCEHLVTALKNMVSP